MKRKLTLHALLFSALLLAACGNSDDINEVSEVDTTSQTQTEELETTKVLKFGDLLDSLKKVDSKKTLQKTILDFKLGMSESAYNRAYDKLKKYEYAPGRMAYDMQFKEGEMAAACEFYPEFKAGKLNKLTINISNSGTSYSFDEIKELLMKRYNTKPVVYDYPSDNQDALWIKDGLLTGLLRAKEGGIKVDVLSFSYSKDMLDEYKFLDEKKAVKNASDAF